MEIWKDIKGYEGLYQVSSEGRVRSFSGKGKNCRILKASKLSNGYRCVTLSKNGVKKNISVHRLAASAFLGKDRDDLVVNHKDGNKENNAVENLEWVTSGENSRHAVDVLGTIRGKRKLTDRQVRAIRKDKRSAVSIAKDYGVTRHTIGRIKKRIYYKEVI